MRRSRGRSAAATTANRAADNSLPGSPVGAPRSTPTRADYAFFFALFGMIRAVPPLGVKTVSCPSRHRTRYLTESSPSWYGGLWNLTVKNESTYTAKLYGWAICAIA